MDGVSCRVRLASRKNPPLKSATKQLLPSRSVREDAVSRDRRDLRPIILSVGATFFPSISRHRFFFHHPPITRSVHRCDSLANLTLNHSCIYIYIYIYGYVVSLKSYNTYINCLIYLPHEYNLDTRTCTTIEQFLTVLIVISTGIITCWSIAVLNFRLSERSISAGCRGAT